MTRGEFYLQSFFIFIVAAIFSLGVVKLYPLVKPLFPVDAEGAAHVVEANTATQIAPSLKPERVAPTRITIPAVEVDLPIAEATITDNQWSLYDNKASWLATSAEPGSGNVIVYAHNRPGLFAPLHKLNIGETITIEHRGKSLNYQVAEVRKVRPDDVEAIISSKNQLTLYTCDGAFDQKRLVVKAQAGVIE